jgi:DNA polymerase III epsilon subunit-like protein
LPFLIQAKGTFTFIDPFIKDMYLFFDTETTGLPVNWRASVTDVNNWPRLVQLAYLYCEADGNVLMSGDYIVKPEGFLIPQIASGIHGISTERAKIDGVLLRDVLQQFEKLIAKAEILVAHNMSFDEKIIGSEFIRAGMPNALSSKRKICTMERTTDFCALKGPYGNKWPKLTELHYTLFGSGFEEAHNAAVDIQATAKCFWELRRRGIIE